MDLFFIGNNFRESPENSQKETSAKISCHTVPGQAVVWKQDVEENISLPVFVRGSKTSLA